MRREDIEAREAAWLAPYAMLSRLSRGRTYGTAPDPYRTEYQRDRDRIIHSRAFRRLSGKTQVFIDGEGDHFRNRLTHTLEVAQVGRSVARRLALNEDLVECIALAHDLGHPPFGHRGEDMLAQLMAEHGGFEHNRQALRIVEELEQRYPEHPGLDLTWEVRESLIKHGDFDGSGVDARFLPEARPLLEAQLIDAVDSIVYDCHDIDDGLRGGYLQLEELQEVPLWRAAWEEAVAGSPRGAAPRLLRDRALRQLLDALIDDLCSATEQRLREDGIVSLSAVRRAQRPLVAHSPLLAARKRELEEFLFAHLYRHYRVNASFHRARRVIAELFAFWVAHPDALPPEHARRIERVGLQRVVADYIAGMTDRFALEAYEQVCR
ncbi:MAG: deoxyguanosinetriphosphate triphosphohydrolase [Planctomycetota bacterium]|nr:deoxyguanosinetriphosphate triphosphohydrolase [Planctomycetota bacterium]MCX8040596.1 deoxyguanosinetriphosphate triphosphohydrolase [Planctomycetota bacterium]MDW8373068.1 deoxyguanosinetriphosphate triphosphohydrolase [Planctomycetota bacterium]